MVFDHVDAGSRGTDDPLRVFENFNEPSGGHPGGFPMTGVKGGLATTGLVHGAVYLDVETAEQGHHGLSHFRIETIHQALYEQSYLLNG